MVEAARRIDASILFIAGKTKLGRKSSELRAESPPLRDGVIHLGADRLPMVAALKYKAVTAWLSCWVLRFLDSRLEPKFSAKNVGVARVGGVQNSVGRGHFDTQVYGNTFITPISRRTPLR